MMATPCYGGLVYETYLRGMTSLAGTTAGFGMNINMATVTNESLVTRARNELVKYMMMTDCTHLFFIDADISFTTEDVLRILLHDKDVVVGAYPLKRVNWDSAHASKASSAKDLQTAATEYVINIRFKNEEEEKTGKVPIVDGLIEVHDAGTGFMCIKRHVIENMINAYPETHYQKEPNFLMHETDDGKRWALFDTMIDEDNRYLSEDYTFCRRWQKIGGSIWLDPGVILSHTGTYLYKGHSIFDIEEAPTGPQGGLIGG